MRPSSRHRFRTSLWGLSTAPHPRERLWHIYKAHPRARLWHISKAHPRERLWHISISPSSREALAHLQSPPSREALAHLQSPSSREALASSGLIQAYGRYTALAPIQIYLHFWSRAVTREFCLFSNGWPPSRWARLGHGTNGALQNLQVLF